MRFKPSFKDNSKRMRYTPHSLLLPLSWRFFQSLPLQSLQFPAAPAHSYSLQRFQPLAPEVLDVRLSAPMLADVQLLVFSAHWLYKIRMLLICIKVCTINWHKFIKHYAVSKRYLSTVSAQLTFSHPFQNLLTFSYLFQGLLTIGYQFLTSTRLGPTLSTPSYLKKKCTNFKPTRRAFSPRTIPIHSFHFLTLYRFILVNETRFYRF